MKYILLFICIFLHMHTLFASGSELPTQNIPTYNSWTINIDDEIQKLSLFQTSINTDYQIDLTSIKDKLENYYTESSFNFEWKLKGATTQYGNVFIRNFTEKWEKELEINIYVTPLLRDEDGNVIENTEKIPFFSHTYSISVYDKSFLLIYSDETNKSDIENYLEFSKQEGLFIDAIWPISDTDLEVSSIINHVKDYKQVSWLKSNFIMIWGSRDFIFNVLWNLNKDLSNINTSEEYNILWISSYNLEILKSYLQNFLSNKNWIHQFILVNESSKYSILKENQIENLITELTNNQQPYLDLNSKENTMKSYLFISKFINNLSNAGYSSNNIYVFLIIPFILTTIIIFKHFIGLSPIGIVIPLFVSLLFLKLWLLLWMSLILIYVGLNLILSIITTRYNLLYAPRMVLLLSINIVFFIFIINLLFSYNFITLNSWDILYFIIFILLSEKMIWIITSKDLLEYKESFFYTLLIWIFCYTILNLSSIKIILLSYPELILLLIPLNFWIWKFTWLRITEYFRFREIIKNIEE